MNSGIVGTLYAALSRSPQCYARKRRYVHGRNAWSFRVRRVAATCTPVAIFFLVTPVDTANGRESFVPLALVEVTVVDVATGTVRANQTVVLENRRIRAVGRVGIVLIPPNAHVIRARGKFLIPGLWDMHVHTVTKGCFLPLYVANGVTGVRDTANDLDRLLRWRSEIAAGRLVGPQMIISGPLVDGPHTVIQGTSIVVANVAAAHSAVIELNTRGADFIKVYNFLSLECLDAILAEARLHNMHVIGHVPLSISAGHAARLGLKSIEHLTGTLLACSSKEGEILHPHPAP